MLTDMRKLLITLDDELSKELAKSTNQNETVRESLRLYIGDITTDRLDKIIMSYKIIDKRLKEIDSKLDYIAGRLK